MSDAGMTKDVSVLQLLTKLVQQTDQLVRLADDIDTYGTTPQSKAAFGLIGSEVTNILHQMQTSLGPLYRLYDLDPGMNAVKNDLEIVSARLIVKSENSD